MPLLMNSKTSKEPSSSPKNKYSTSKNNSKSKYSRNTKSKTCVLLSTMIIFQQFSISRKRQLR